MSVLSLEMIILGVYYARLRQLSQRARQAAGDLSAAAALEE
jgi:hypothetical protein